MGTTRSSSEVFIKLTLEYGWRSQFEPVASGASFLSPLVCGRSDGRRFSVIAGKLE